MARRGGQWVLRLVRPALPAQAVLQAREVAVVAQVDLVAGMVVVLVFEKGLGAT
jgi:hypothetical protein